MENTQSLYSTQFTFWNLLPYKCGANSFTWHFFLLLLLAKKKKKIELYMGRKYSKQNTNQNVILLIFQIVHTLEVTMKVLYGELSVSKNHKD